MHEKNRTLVTPEGYKLSFRERESAEIKLNIPKDVLASLEKIAVEKNLSIESVLKFFISQGLRTESAKNAAKESVVKRLKDRKSVEEKVDIDLAAQY